MVRILRKIFGSFLSHLRETPISIAERVVQNMVFLFFGCKGQGSRHLRYPGNVILLEQFICTLLRSKSYHRDVG